MLALLLVGCGAEPTDGGGDSGIAYADFRAAYIEGYCSWYLDCHAETAALNDLHSVGDCMASTDVREVRRWSSDCYDYDELAAVDCLGGLRSECAGGGYIAEDACDSVCDE